MADKSVAGCNTVDEYYLTYELASDSDDEKRMKQAEARALSKKKAMLESYNRLKLSSKCLTFMTSREGCFVIHVEYKYLSEALVSFFHHQFSKR